MPLRPITRFFSSLVSPFNGDVIQFREAPSDKLAWMQLRQLTDDPEQAMALFSGSRAERNSLYKEFRNYVRQARIYWTVGSRTEGSAAALPYYYSALNLAKAELLKTHASVVLNQFPHHGLRLRATSTSSIRGDRLATQRGVFSFLYEKRVGSQLPRSSLRVVNLLSLISEIGHEMAEFGRSRPSALPVLHTVASDPHSAWSLLLVESFPPLDPREPIARTISRNYEQIALTDFPQWRELFAVSSRTVGNWVTLYQSKQVFTLASAGGPAQPDFGAAARFPGDIFGAAVGSPVGRQCEFLLVPTLTKTTPLVMPVSLARYASLFYLSSLVRYKPSSLDPQSQGKQAWLFDSFVSECALALLTEATDGITGKTTFFEPHQYRL